MKMKNSTKYVLIGVGIFMAVWTVVLGLLLPTSTTTPTGASKSDAYIMAQKFVKARLKAPSTAEFPAQSKVTIKKMEGENTFAVAGYVDAENSFGAHIRQKYLCGVTTADGTHWNLVSFEWLD